MNLVSGMVLVEKIYGDLNFLISTPYGWKAIDANGSCIEFCKDNYEKAYIPVDYNDPWLVSEGTDVIFK
jgi:hypothetical protein